MNTINPRSAFTLVDADGYALTPVASAVIASGASLSAAVELDGKMPCGFFIPASFEGGYIQLQVSHDGTNFFDVCDESGAKVQLTAASSTFVRLSNPAGLLGIAAMKVRSVDSGGSAANQTGDATVAISLQGA